MDADSLVDLLRRFQAEGVQYILVGGQAVRLNGLVRATEHIDSLQPHVRTVTVERVDIRTLDMEGLFKTKTDYRHKDRIDREVLERLGAQL